MLGKKYNILFSPLFPLKYDFWVAGVGILDYDRLKFRSILVPGLAIK